MFAITGSEGGIKLNIIFPGNLILYKMAKVTGFDKYKEYEPESIEIGVGFHGEKNNTNQTWPQMT